MIEYHNPLKNLVGNCPEPKRRPSYKDIVEDIITGIAKEDGSGICWNPVSHNGTKIIYKQCPGACGYVWKFEIEDKDISNWLVNRINERRIDIVKLKDKEE